MLKSREVSPILLCNTDLSSVFSLYKPQIDASKFTPNQWIHSSAVITPGKCHLKTQIRLLLIWELKEFLKEKLPQTCSWTLSPGRKMKIWSSRPLKLHRIVHCYLQRIHCLKKYIYLSTLVNEDIFGFIVKRWGDSKLLLFIFFFFACSNKRCRAVFSNWAFELNLILCMCAN